ncbi:MAG: amidase [Planctomyces sp.]|nr:amidase [Planctomyces sp.]
MPVPASACFDELPALAAGLGSGRFTSRELTALSLERCERHGPRYNAVAAVLRDQALAAADRADAERAAGRNRGRLHGIPYAAKDLLAWPGAPTTWGAAPYAMQIIDRQATVLKRLADAGAILFAKLAMVEIAGGLGYRQANASLTGPGRNPWGTDRWSGGSSSGSGSAVAGGLVPFAIGSETWGSITTPAGYCGITGLRPTFGLVSRAGAMPLSWTMDKLGVLSRTAADALDVLNVIEGQDPEDPATVARPAESAREADAPCRFAVLRGATERVQPEVATNFDAALDVLREFGPVTETELPELPFNDVASLIISCEGAAAHENLLRDGRIAEMTAPENRWSLYANLMIPAVDYLRALRILRVMQRELSEWMTRFDVVLTPTLATVAGPVTEPFSSWAQGFESTQISAASNLAGFPALTVPSGFGADGLPTGLQLVGPAFSERLLADIAGRYQAATDWHRRTPPPLPDINGPLEP